MTAPTWTDRNGKPTPLAMTMRAPFILIVDGREVADFGADKEKALAAYDSRTHAHYRARGIQPVRIDGGCAL